MYFKSIVSFPGYMTGIIIRLPVSSLPILANMEKVTSPCEAVFSGETTNTFKQGEGRGLEQKQQQRQCQGELPATGQGAHKQCKEVAGEKKGKIKNGTGWLKTT